MVEELARTSLERCDVAPSSDLDPEGTSFVNADPPPLGEWRSLGHVRTDRWRSMSPKQAPLDSTFIEPLASGSATLVRRPMPTQATYPAKVETRSAPG